MRATPIIDALPRKAMAQHNGAPSDCQNHLPPMQSATVRQRTALPKGNRPGGQLQETPGTIRRIGVHWGPPACSADWRPSQQSTEVEFGNVWQNCIWHSAASFEPAEPKGASPANSGSGKRLSRSWRRTCWKQRALAKMQGVSMEITQIRSNTQQNRRGMPASGCGATHVRLPRMRRATAKRSCHTHLRWKV